MGTVIKVESLAKRFVLGPGRASGYVTLREAVSNGLRARPSRAAPEPFWALKDVSFELERGDRLGIVGRNGAGKSTLLKVLSRITEPTSGRVEIAGRTASLLEVGTGFHPELTGRENIYLNGVILGMTRVEIARRFDDIVEFAEVEEFLDTPVKRYSSGMYVRLAFAVAAHLEAEILIVDEVLAVGDIAFQKRCLARLGEVGKSGRTVIFVSHNLEAIARLCNKGILLARGHATRQGSIVDVLAAYKSEVLLNSELAARHRHPGPGSSGVTIKSVWCTGIEGGDIRQVGKMNGLRIHMEADVDERLRDGRELTVAFGIDTDAGYRLFTCISSWGDRKFVTTEPMLRAQCVLPIIPFVPGTYLVTAAVLNSHDMLDHLEHCASFQVTDDGARYFMNRGVEHGHVDIPFHFEPSG